MRALLLCLLLTGCGAGLDEIDSRPECSWSTVANQSQPVCKVPA